jgi:ActR/RegA family two-component response regulator
MDALTPHMDARPRMLLVYGDSVFAARCSRHFRRSGWDVHLAVSSDEACRLMDRLTPTGVVVDAELAGERGAEACRRIAERYPGQPLVLLTADEATDLAPPVDSVRISRRDSISSLMDQLLVAVH